MNIDVAAQPEAAFLEEKKASPSQVVQVLTNELIEVAFFELRCQR
jgi:hypothetical protein